MHQSAEGLSRYRRAPLQVHPRLAGWVSRKVYLQQRLLLCGKELELLCEVLAPTQLTQACSCSSRVPAHQRCWFTCTLNSTCSGLLRPGMALRSKGPPRSFCWPTTPAKGFLVCLKEHLLCGCRLCGDMLGTSLKHLSNKARPLNASLNSAGQVVAYVCGFPCTPWSLLHYRSALMQDPNTRQMLQTVRNLRDQSPAAPRHCDFVAFLDSEVCVLENVKGFLRAMSNFKVFLKKNCPEQLGLWESAVSCSVRYHFCAFQINPLLGLPAFVASPFRGRTTGRQSAGIVCT